MCVVFSQMHPFPYEDDYDAVLAFATRFSTTHGFVAKTLYVAAAQHNEYKLIFPHVIVVGELLLMHRVNIPFLTVIGNLLLVAVGLVLWRF